MRDTAKTQLLLCAGRAAERPGCALADPMCGERVRPQVVPDGWAHLSSGRPDQDCKYWALHHAAGSVLMFGQYWPLAAQSHCQVGKTPKRKRKNALGGCSCGRGFYTLVYCRSSNFVAGRLRRHTQSIWVPQRRHRPPLPCLAGREERRMSRPARALRNHEPDELMIRSSVCQPWR
jgi:hypothetical protein